MKDGAVDEKDMMARRILQTDEAVLEEQQRRSEYAARVAGLIAAVMSGVAVVACLVFLPMLSMKINEITTQLHTDSAEFNTIAENAWGELMKKRFNRRYSRQVPAREAYNTATRRGATTNRQPNNRNGQTGTTYPDRKVLNAPTCECSTHSNCPSGPPGPRGDPGREGLRGAPGGPGGRGLQGTMPLFEGGYKPSGSCRVCPNGPRGIPGQPGKPGTPGSPGEPGFPGRPGQDQPPGRPGQPGEAGDSGKSGTPGEPGFPGQNGVRGTKGEKGKRGTPGSRGQKGSPGLAGRNGNRGQNGHSGQPGHKGNPGLRGDPGFRGATGPPGLPGRDAGYCDCPPRSPGSVGANPGGAVRPQPYNPTPAFTDRPVVRTQPQGGNYPARGVIQPGPGRSYPSDGRRVIQPQPDDRRVVQPRPRYSGNDRQAIRPQFSDRHPIHSNGRSRNVRPISAVVNRRVRV